MGGTRLARTRIAELKKKIVHAQEKKKEFSDFLRDLKASYHRGEISYANFLETFYQKRNGLSIQEWIEHFDDFVKQCKREILKEKFVIYKTQLTFVFVFAVFISIITVPLFLLQPKFLGFTIEDGIQEDTQMISEENISEETPAEIPGQEIQTENIPTENISDSEELNEAVQNESSPSHQAGQESEPPQTSENETEIVEENITEDIVDIPEEVPEIPENETQIEIPANETEIFENATILNETLVNETLIENITYIGDAEIKTIQFQAVLNNPVKWRKTITSDETGKVLIAIPGNSDKIKVNKTENEVEGDVTLGTTITGGVVGSQENFIYRFLKNILGRITGNVVAESFSYTEVEVDINDSNVEYEIEYETPAPYSTEEKIKNGKRVKVFGPEDVHYTDVLAYTDLNENLNLKNPEKVKIFWVEDNSYITPASIEDKDGNGIYDYVEWIVPHLSNQTFEIIVITKAEHLDENYTFVSDIYEEVKSLDGIWSEEIQENHFVRVTFEKNLTNENDITIYPRITSGNPRVEIYEKEGLDLITEFSNLTENEYNKVFLTNLISESQDVFDLKVIGGSLEFEHIVDPKGNYDYNSGQGTLHFIYESPNSGGTFPPLFTDGFGGTEIASYTNVQSDNTAYITQVGGSNTEPYFRFNFTISETPASIDSIFIHIRGRAAFGGGEDVDCFVANFTASNWDKICDMPATNGDCDVNLTGSTDYIQGNQFVYLCFGKNLDAPDNISIDYTNITVYSTAADNVKPDLTIQVPSVNNTNTTNINQNVNFTIFDDVALDSAWYANDTYSVANKSLGSGGTYFNITNLTWGQGKHNVTIYVNDTNNNVNFSTISFTIDSTNPLVTIATPTTNNTNSSNNNLDVNYTATDTFTLIDSVWYNNDTFSVANKSLGSGGTFFNISNLTWGEGKHNVTIYANDTVGNVNFTTISFTVDTIQPAISILNPSQNNTNNTNTLDVNFTASDSGSGLFNCWYSNDTYLVNTSLATCGTNITTVTWSDAKHNVTVWANDSAGNYNFSTISFTIDSVNPSLSILIPEVNNTNTTNINQNINFTFSDSLGIDSIWYNNDTNLGVNKSLGVGGNYFNITNLTWGEGKHNVTIYVNDSAGNLNYTSVSFTIDTTQPDVNITFPFNNSVVSYANVEINYTRLDSGSGLFNCWYSNDTYLVNTTLSSCENVTTITWSEQQHNVTVWANDSAGNYNRTTIGFTVTLDSPPEIREVFNNTVSIIAAASGINSGPLNTSIIINFSVYDANGVANMDNSTATINFSKTGESLRQNASCNQYEVGTNIANYTCNVTMSWYDGAGTWAIQAFISDLDSNDANNKSTNFSVGETTGFEMGSLSWSSLAPGQTNQTATTALRLNNTGNKNQAQNTTQVNATNLRGETTTTQWIFAENISVSWDATSLEACDTSGSVGVRAVNLSNTTYTNISLANLTKGNYLVNDGSTGQEDFYFCIKTVGSELTSQSYSTSAYGPWQVRILLAFAAIPNRRKRRTNAEASSFGRKKKKEKKTEKDKLIDALDLSEYLHVADKLKEEFHFSKDEIIRTIIEKANKKYGVDREELLRIIKAREGISIPITIYSKKLGALESLAKYMKENLGMTYKEIAKELKRDERTIWTAYKKANEKQEEKIDVKKTDIMIPTSIFENKELTILEAIIIYLKEKGMKYSEIAELIERDERNIWTVYSRAKKKIK